MFKEQQLHIYIEILKRGEILLFSLVISFSFFLFWKYLQKMFTDS